MKVLVTGGGGFLGRALCAALRRDGHAVTSFQRSRSPALDALDVRQVQGDAPLTYQGQPVDVMSPFERLTIREAILKYTDAGQRVDDADWLRAD